MYGLRHTYGRCLRGFFFGFGFFFGGFAAYKERMGGGGVWGLEGWYEVCRLGWVGFVWDGC